MSTTKSPDGILRCRNTAIDLRLCTCPDCRPDLTHLHDLDCPYCDPAQEETK